ncbi:MAG TPA: thioredoxin domain-containing protein [Anaerolineales bacterium]|nr:thioredoxin domain-containing protein [Anaerolineales bacterium]
MIKRSHNFWLVFLGMLVMSLSACQLFTGQSDTSSSGAATPLGLVSSPTTDPLVENGNSPPTPDPAYPGPPTEVPTATPNLSYPGPPTKVPTATPNLSYPGPGSEFESGVASVTAQPTNTISSYPGPDLGGSATSSPTSTLDQSGVPYPGPGTPTTLPGQTQVGPTPTYTVAPGQPTPTSGPTSTASLVVTQTNTPMPIPTQTPVPPPAWISSKLVATDPNEVILASGKVQLVQFFAFWCGPCQAMAPLIHGLEDRYQDQMNFIYLDIDDPDTAELKEQLSYQSQPHFFLLDEYGIILEQWLGAVPVDVLTQAIEAALQ